MLHDEKFGALGVLTMENTAGEESIMGQVVKNKKDAAYSQKETYLLEFRHEHWQIFRETLFTMGKRAEYIKLERLLSHNAH